MGKEVIWPNAKPTSGQNCESNPLLLSLIAFVRCSCGDILAIVQEAIECTFFLSEPKL